MRHSLHLLLLTAVLVLVLVSGCRSGATPEPMTRVVVAATDIPSDCVLTTAMLTTSSIPTRYAQPHAVRDPAEVAGRLTPSVIFAGEQILESKLASEDDLAMKTPKGFRALTLPLAPGEFSGTAGNYVDVIGLFDFGDATKSDPRSVTLFQNVYVLAVAKAEARTPATVSLMVNPEEAEKLVLADAAGTLYLSLRSKFEGNTQVALEQIDIHKAIGIPERIYHAARRPYPNGGPAVDYPW